METGTRGAASDLKARIRDHIRGWIDPDVTGIATGITLLSAENVRTGNVWSWFTRNQAFRLAMDRVGLRRA